MKLFFSMLLFSNIFFSQDTIQNISLVAGSNFKINKGKIWKLESVYISDYNSYNIKVSNKYFKNVYNVNDTLKVPYYIPEMELLSNRSLVSFQITLKELFKSKK